MKCQFAISLGLSVGWGGVSIQAKLVFDRNEPMLKNDWKQKDGLGKCQCNFVFLLFFFWLLFI